MNVLFHGFFFMPQNYLYVDFQWIFVLFSSALYFLRIAKMSLSGSICCCIVIYVFYFISYLLKWISHFHFIFIFSSPSSSSSGLRCLLLYVKKKKNKSKQTVLFDNRKWKTVKMKWQLPTVFWQRKYSSFHTIESRTAINWLIRKLYIYFLFFFRLVCGICCITRSPFRKSNDILKMNIDRFCGHA